MLESSGNPTGKESWGSTCVHTHACTRTWVEGGRQGLASSLESSALPIRPKCMWEVSKQENDRCKQGLSKINLVEWQMDWIQKQLEKGVQDLEHNKNLLGTYSTDAWSQGDPFWAMLIGR